MFGALFNLQILLGYCKVDNLIEMIEALDCIFTIMKSIIQIVFETIKFLQ